MFLGDDQFDNDYRRSAGLPAVELESVSAGKKLGFEINREFEKNCGPHCEKCISHRQPKRNEQDTFRNCQSAEKLIKLYAGIV